MEQHEQVTIAEYQLTAEAFRAGTWEHDVSQNRDSLVRFLPKNPGKILDIGCGPRRDLVAFKQQGHTVIGLDATPAFVNYRTLTLRVQCGLSWRLLTRRLVY